jgi:hypothetical protein
MARQPSTHPEWDGIARYLQAQLQDPVELLCVTAAGATPDPRTFASQEAAALANFLAQRVPRLDVTVRSPEEVRTQISAFASAAPAFLLAVDGVWRIRYLGVPLGSEVQPFLEALVLLSRHEAPFPPVTLRLLQNLRTVHLAFYFTPT